MRRSFNLSQGFQILQFDGNEAEAFDWTDYIDCFQLGSSFSQTRLNTVHFFSSESFFSMMVEIMWNRRRGEVADRKAGGQAVVAPDLQGCRLGGRQIQGGDEFVEQGLKDGRRTGRVGQGAVLRGSRQCSHRNRDRELGEFSRA